MDKENKARCLNAIIAAADRRIAALSHDLQAAVGCEREGIARDLKASIRVREWFARPRWLN